MRGYEGMLAGCPLTRCDQKAVIGKCGNPRDQNGVENKHGSELASGVICGCFGECRVLPSCARPTSAAAPAVSDGLGTDRGFLVLRGVLWVNSDRATMEIRERAEKS